MALLLPFFLGLGLPLDFDRATAATSVATDRCDCRNYAYA